MCVLRGEDVKQFNLGGEPEKKNVLQAAPALRSAVRGLLHGYSQFGDESITEKAQLRNAEKKTYS